MGKIKYIGDIRKFFRKNAVVDINSLKKFISIYRGNEKYVYLLVSNMIKKGEIKRITKGCYSLHEDPVLAVFCFRPAYIGLQNALSIHDIWEQETVPVMITTGKIRPGTRQILGTNTVLRRIVPKYFFGIEYVKEGDFYIPVSDIEKTFIDMVYFRQRMDKELLRNFRKRIDAKKLKGYLRRYPARVCSMVGKLLGYGKV